MPPGTAATRSTRAPRAGDVPTRPRVDPGLMHAATKLADVPKHVTPACSARSHSAEVGGPGLPSNSTTDASVRPPPFRKFHIIQPAVVNRRRDRPRAGRRGGGASSASPAGSRRARARSPSAAPSCRSCTAPQRVVERDLRERELVVRALREEVLPPRRAVQPAEVGEGRGRRPRPCAPGSAAPPGAGGRRRAERAHGPRSGSRRSRAARAARREPVDHAAHAEVRRAARPDGADGRAGVEADDRLDDVRQVRDDAVPGRRRSRGALPPRVASRRAARPRSSP